MSRGGEEAGWKREEEEASAWWRACESRKGRAKSLALETLPVLNGRQRVSVNYIIPT